MSTPEDQNWQAIFSALLSEQDIEIGGRAAIPDDLRSDLERLARGELNQPEIRKLCERVVLSQDALAALAFLLQESRDRASAREDS